MELHEPTSKQLDYLERKMIEAEELAEKHEEALSLALGAFYNAFGVHLSGCCGKCAGSKLSQVETLFWDLVNNGSEEPVEGSMYRLIALVKDASEELKTDG